MLLRLIPAPTDTNPTPPTILFTLPPPKPTHPHQPTNIFNPYTAQNLVAPPALLAHQSLCTANDLPSHTILTGESSSWIGTVVKEVTFLPLLGRIEILLLSGGGVVVPIKEGQEGLNVRANLDGVRDHVLESGRLVAEEKATQAEREKATMRALAFANGPPSAPIRPKHTREGSLSQLIGSMFSMRRTSSSSSISIRSTSSTKSSGASSMTSVASSTPSLPSWGKKDERMSVASKDLTSRQHRKAARSLLVDCYRRWVLTALKTLLPANYLLFMSQAELKRSANSLAKTDTHLRSYLARSEALSSLPPTPSSPSASLSSSGPDSSSTDTLTLHTPAPSTCPSSTLDLPKSCSPSDYPPPSALPPHVRTTYQSYIANLLSLDSKVTNLTKFHRRQSRIARQATADRENIISIRIAEKAASCKPESSLRWEILATERTFDECPPLSPSCSSNNSSSCGASSGDEAEADDGASVYSEGSDDVDALLEMTAYTVAYASRSEEELAKVGVMG